MLPSLKRMLSKLRATVAELTLHRLKMWGLIWPYFGCPLVLMENAGSHWLQYPTLQLSQVQL